MNKLNSKKASFNLLVEFALVVAVITIVSIMVFNINDDARSTIVDENYGTRCGLNATGGTGAPLLYDGCGASYNATLDSDEAVSKVPSKLPLLATAVIFGVVLYVILRVIPIKVTGESF